MKKKKESLYVRYWRSECHRRRLEMGYPECEFECGWIEDRNKCFGKKRVKRLERVKRKSKRRLNR
jgi:hypothetical protein